MIGIILLNYKSYDDTVNCVSSILESNLTNFKIYIVDNNSPDNSFEDLRSKYMEHDLIEVVNSNKNGGYSSGNNFGIRLAKADKCKYILISNTDIIYSENSISNLQNKLKINNEAAIVSPLILDKDGSIGQSFFYAPSVKGFFKKTFPVRLLFKPEFPSDFENDIYFNGMTQGSCYLTTINFLEEINFLDENVFLFGEESILAHKLQLLNKKTLVDSDTTVFHNHSSSISKEGHYFEKFNNYKSNFYVLTRYTNASLTVLNLARYYYIAMLIVEKIINRNSTGNVSEFKKTTAMIINQFRR